MPGQKQGKSPKLERAGKKPRIVADPKPVTRHKRKAAPFDPRNSFAGTMGNSHVGDAQRRRKAAYDKVRAYQLCERTALQLMEELDSKMVSSSKRAHESLRKAFATFMDAYVSADSGMLSRCGVTRAEYALNWAVAETGESHLLRYIQRTVRSTVNSVQEPQPQPLAKAS